MRAEKNFTFLYGLLTAVSVIMTFLIHLCNPFLTNKTPVYGRMEMKYYFISIDWLNQRALLLCSAGEREWSGERRLQKQVRGWATTFAAHASLICSVTTARSSVKIFCLPLLFLQFYWTVNYGRNACTSLRYADWKASSPCTSVR